MKVLNRICQALCIACGLGALLLFFMNFATISFNGQSETLVGTVIAFGGKTKGIVSKEAVKMATSSKILFCLVLTTIGAVMSIFSYRKKGLRYVVPFIALGDAIFMLVAYLSIPGRFIDLSAFANYPNTDVMLTKVEYSPLVLVLCILLFAFAIFATAYLFIDDYIEVQESKGKKTILQRIGLFFRDYKSEVKKIVWPGMSDVVKNTIIVLAMCLILGVFIWLLDWGLASLLKLVLQIKTK